MAKSSSTATWRGSTVEGEGTVSTASPALDDVSLTWKARIGEEAGTTPEELLAAAHAGCYSMALSFALTGAGHEPTRVDVEATAEFGPVDGGFAVTGVTLSVDADVPGIDEETFEQLANGAKDGCPLSKLMHGNVPITLRARLAASH